MRSDRKSTWLCCKEFSTRSVRSDVEYACISDTAGEQAGGKQRACNQMRWRREQGPAVGGPRPIWVGPGARAQASEFQAQEACRKR